MLLPCVFVLVWSGLGRVREAKEGKIIISFCLIIIQ